MERAGRASGAPSALGCVALVATGCLVAPMARTDIAIIDAGDATIHSIDRAPVQPPSRGAFQVRPGGHTLDVSADVAEYGLHTLAGVTRVYRTGLVSLCVKARPGRRYRVTTEMKDHQPRIFIVDRSTGEPPKTPCGPDEEDD